MDQSMYALVLNETRREELHDKMLVSINEFKELITNKFKLELTPEIRDKLIVINDILTLIEEKENELIENNRTQCQRLYRYIAELSTPQ